MGSNSQRQHSNHKLDPAYFMASPDRFQTPKASLIYTKMGTPACGLPERPGMRVLRHAFEDAKHHENVTYEASSLRPPAGRRHDAALRYQAALQRAGKLHSHDADLERSSARCQRHRSLQTSLDNPLLRGWGCCDAAVPAQPYAAPAQAARSFNSRYAARAAFEAAHAVAFSQAEQRKKCRRQWLGACRDEISRCRPHEEAALREFPHGLPALQLRSARQRGLQLGGLGFGIAPTRADERAAVLRNVEPCREGDFR